MVELVAIEIEAANQRVDGAISRVSGNKGGLDFWKLAYLPCPFFVFLHTYERPDVNALVQRDLLCQGGLDKKQCVPADFGDFTALAVGTHELWGCFQNDGWNQVVVV